MVLWVHIASIELIVIDSRIHRISIPRIQEMMVIVVHTLKLTMPSFCMPRMLWTIQPFTAAPYRKSRWTTSESIGTLPAKVVIMEMYKRR